MVDRVPESAAMSRWAQLTYASFDAEGGRGGWQVKQTSGDLGIDERDQLSARVVTSFNSHVPVPQFATDDELANLPRRFSYTLDQAGTATYWHAVQAGTDSTGRPGNVFTHIVLDRRPREQTPVVRPIELWRSPDLLVPFGAARVAAAILTAEPFPRLGAVVTLQSTIAFVLDDTTWRVGLLCVLMDAIAEALAGGRHIVFLAESPDSAARWLGAVAHLTSASSSRQLSWSLYERAAGLDAVWARGIHFAAVPVHDAYLITATADVIVIREDETPLLGAVGDGPHTTQAGSQVAVTEWSEMAQMVLVDPDIAEATLTRMNEIIPRVGDRELALDWPLAMSVTLGGPDVADALPEAMQVIMRSSPAAIRQDAELFAVARGVASTTLGSSASEVWAQLLAVDRTTSLLVYDLLVVGYLGLAISDREWLMQPGSVPLPAGDLTEFSGDPELHEIAATALREADDSATESFDDAVYHLRLVDLLLRIGLLDPAGEMGPEQVALQLLLGAASERLRDRQTGPALADRVGATCPALRTGLLRRAMADWPDPERLGSLSTCAPGQRLMPAVTGWLCDEDITAVLLDDLAHGDGRASAFELEVAIWRSGHGDTRPGLAAIVVVGLLDHYTAWSAFPPAVARHCRDNLGTWSVADLAAVETAHPGALPAPYFSHVLVTAPWNPALASLCAALATRSNLGTARDLPQLRPYFALEPSAPAENDIFWTDTAQEGLRETERMFAALDELGPTLTSQLNWSDIGRGFLFRLVRYAEAHEGEGQLQVSADFIRRASAGNSADLTAALLQREIDQSTTPHPDLARSAVLALSCLPDLPVKFGSRYLLALALVRCVVDGRDTLLLEVILRHALGRPDVNASAIVADAIDTVRMKVPGRETDIKRRASSLDVFDRVTAVWAESLNPASGAHLTPETRKTSRFGFLAADRKAN